MVFNKGLVALLIFSMFLLSSCEVYQTFSGTTGNVVSEDTEDENSQETVEDTTDTSEETTEVTEEVVPEETATEEVVEEAPAEETSEALPVEMPKEKPVVILVEETALVNLVPKAEDPDKDSKLAFTFTSPLSESGEWQTTYGDAGEYTVTVTVSDGESTTSRDVLIIVNKKEEAPTIDASNPIESGLVADETQSLDFSAEASDLNRDALSYEWKLDGEPTGTETQYTYQTTYDDAGTHTVKVDVTDGISSASKIWSVEVKNVNRKPVLEGISDISASETDTIVITALATDDDNNNLAYSISDPRFTQEDNVFTWETGYDSAGTYTVVVSASDGQDTTEQEITVDVANVNRAPVITEIVQK